MKRFTTRYIDDVMYITVIITAGRESTEHQFLIDTGASRCILSQRIAEYLGFDINAIAEQSENGIATATEIIYPKRVTLDSFTAIGLTKMNFRMDIVDFPDDMDGVIGNDFLKLIGDVNIRYPNSTREAYIEVP